MSEKQKLPLRFEDRAEFLAVAAALIGEESVENPQPDGWFSVKDEKGNEVERVYWNLFDIGDLPQTTGEGEDAVTVILPGYHVNGIWHSARPIPELLVPFVRSPERWLMEWGC